MGSVLPGHRVSENIPNPGGLVLERVKTNFSIKSILKTRPPTENKEDLSNPTPSVRPGGWDPVSRALVCLRNVPEGFRQIHRGYRGEALGEGGHGQVNSPVDRRSRYGHFSCDVDLAKVEGEKFCQPLDLKLSQRGESPVPTVPCVWL